MRRLNRNSEPQASIEAGKYTLQFVPLQGARAMPRKSLTEEQVLIASGGKQLPPPRFTLLPHHLRQILPSQISLHIPLGPRYRIHYHLLQRTVSTTPPRPCRAWSTHKCTDPQSRGLELFVREHPLREQRTFYKQDLMLTSKPYTDTSPQIAAPTPSLNSTPSCNAPKKPIKTAAPRKTSTN